jgi:hypothetical protein
VCMFGSRLIVHGGLCGVNALARENGWKQYWNLAMSYKYTSFKELVSSLSHLKQACQVRIICRQERGMHIMDIAAEQKNSPMGCI